MELFLTTPELEARMAALGDSPRDGGTLAMIVCRPAVDQRIELEQAEITAEDGLVGDGWRVRTDSDGLDTQITIINSRLIQALAPDRARWALAGDQLYVDLDLSQENLPSGQRLALGTAILEVSQQPHTGCSKFTARFGSDATRFINSREGRQARRRGLNARVLQGGVIRLGDVMTKVG